MEALTMRAKVATIDNAMRWEIVDPEPHHRYMGLLFERDITPTRNLAAGFVILPPKQEQPKLNTHHHSEEVYIVIQGNGKLVLAGEEVKVERESAVYIAPGCQHRAISTGDEEMQLV